MGGSTTDPQVDNALRYGQAVLGPNRIRLGMAPLVDERLSDRRVTDVLSLRS